MEISRTQWDAVASFSISMHSVFYTEENASDGVLTIDHVIEKGWLQPVFDSGLTLEKLKDYMEYVVKKGGGTEYGSEKKSGGARLGSGRKKSERELVKVTVRIFKDQQPISDTEIRAAIDIYLSSRHG